VSEHEDSMQDPYRDALADLAGALPGGPSIGEAINVLRQARDRIAFLNDQVKRLQTANTEEVERRRAAEVKAKLAYPEDHAKKLSIAVGDIHAEATRACKQHPPFASAHEGFAVLWEEVEELWREVQKRQGEARRIRFEAMQVGAMAARIMAECPE
jgi:hypothetical protein